MKKLICAAIVAGSMVAMAEETAKAEAPAVPAQSAAIQQVAPQAATTVWVEGRYIDQVQPNGSVTRVWNPGHYETR